MFRTMLSLAVLFILSHTGSAGVILSSQIGGGDITGSAKTAERITQDHFQTQLDWRSYYLSRMAVRRHDLERVSGTSHQPSAGSTN